MSRLAKEVRPGDTSIFVGAGLDWKAGDKIGILPTSMQWN